MKTNIRTLTIGAAMLLAGAAQGQQFEGVEGTLDTPLVVTQNGTSHVRMTEHDGTRSYEVEIKDGKLTAKIDGKKVPAKRVKREGGTVTILDDAGEVLKTFEVGEAGSPRAFAFRGGQGGRLFVTPSAPAAPQPPAVAWTEVKEPPKTMIGIRMDDEAEGDVVLTDVVENLPAAKAGLLAGDTLVSIAGTKITQVTDVREAIKDKNAGDKVEVVVRRDGEEKTFTVTLEAWDQATLYKGMPEDEVAKLGDALGQAGQSTGKFAEEARLALEKALREIQSSESKAQFDKSWSDAMKQAMKALEQTQADTHQWLRSFSAPTTARGTARVYTPSAQGGVYTFAAPEGASREALNQRLDEMNERLDALSARLDKLVEALEKRKP